MKTLRIILLTVFTIAVALFSACNKDKDNEKDYRDKWIGTYDCEKIRSFSDQEEQVLIDIIAKGDSMLNITERDLEEYRLGLKYDVKVYSDGTFDKMDDDRPYVSGSFFKDSLYVGYSTHSPGSGLRRIIYIGKKLK